MLPIVRRTRHPLTEPEVATIVPPPEIRSDFGQLRSEFAAGDTPPPQPLTIVADNQRSSPTPPAALETSGPNKQLSTATGSSPSPSGEGRDEGDHDERQPAVQPRRDAFIQQPSTNPWSLQLDEPAADYQLFAAWLQLPPPRTMRQASASLGCSVHRLRRLALRHHWQFRANSFDNHRAAAASKALDQLLDDEFSNLKQRAERFRLQEWLLHEEMLEAARAAAQDLKSHPRRLSIKEIARLFDLASALGRRAAGMPLDPASADVVPPQLNWDAEAALRKIYGDSSSNSGEVSSM